MRYCFGFCLLFCLFVSSLIFFFMFYFNCFKETIRNLFIFGVRIGLFFSSPDVLMMVLMVVSDSIRICSSWPRLVWIFSVSNGVWVWIAILRFVLFELQQSFQQFASFRSSPLLSRHHVCKSSSDFFYLFVGWLVSLTKTSFCFELWLPQKWNIWIFWRRRFMCVCVRACV